MNDRWRASLFAKITWLAIAASLLMTLILTVFVVEFFNIASAHHRNNYGRIIKGVAMRVYENPSPDNIARIAEESDTDLRYHSPDFNYVSDDDMPDFGEVQHIRKLRRSGVVLAAGNGRLVALHYVGQRRLMIHLGSVNGPWDVASGVILPLMLALASLWTGFYLLQRKMLAPLTKLRDDMEAVGAGVWRQTDIKRRDEIGELAVVFNQMQRRLRALLESKERFLADASHELRSPLARLRLSLEFVEETKLRDNMMADVAELENLTGDILEKTRLDNFRQTLNKSPHCVDEIFAVLRRKYSQAVFGGDTTAIIFGDKKILIRALSNLLDNALKFSSAAATITCEQTATTVSLIVKDDGPGVAEKDLPHLFEPFYRADASRSRNTGGFGLGLSIVHAAVAAHDGDMCAVNKLPCGLVVKIMLPNVANSKSDIKSADSDLVLHEGILKDEFNRKKQ